jgi:hypothetical protein
VDDAACHYIAGVNLPGSQEPENRDLQNKPAVAGVLRAFRPCGRVVKQNLYTIVEVRKTDIRPYTPTPGDLCGRCAGDRLTIVARRHHPNGWIINVCDWCLTAEEKQILNETLDEALYLAGLR